jgi:hypothetical protein
VANLEDWIAWALVHDIAPEVITFLRVRPDMLDSCGGQEQTEQMVKPSPRSWARVSTVLHATQNARHRTMAVNGYVGEAVAVQFFHTLEELRHLPAIDKLLGMPAKQAAILVPATLPTLYGLAYSLVRYTEKSEHFERAVELLDAVAGIRDELPRREIQTLGMELLLGKAHQTGLFAAVTGSETYGRIYSSKARELVQ